VILGVSSEIDESLASSVNHISLIVGFRHIRTVNEKLKLITGDMVTVISI
jgi:hypothetical protein